MTRLDDYTGNPDRFGVGLNDSTQTCIEAFGFVGLQQAAGAAPTV